MANPIYTRIREPRDKDKQESSPLPSKLALNVKAQLVKHTGKENKIIMRDLSMLIWKTWTKTTQRYIRDAVSELVCDFGEAIVADYESDDGGLYYAQTDTEFDLAISNLQSRRDVLNQRIDSLYQAKSRMLHQNKKAAQSKEQDALFSMTPSGFF